MLLGSCLQALPRQRPAVEVHEHVAEGLHVVAARLLDAQVGVDAGVARRTRQVLVFSVIIENIGNCLKDLELKVVVKSQKWFLMSS